MALKRIIYFLAFSIGMFACNHKASDQSEKQFSDSVSQKLPDSLKVVLPQEKQSGNSNLELEANKDSSFFISDSLFVDLKPDLRPFSENSFQGYSKNYKPNCALDANGFIKGKGLTFSHNCNEICEAFLTDEKRNLKLTLPSNYDAGIMGLLFSPDCSQFIVYSSYDGPDYTNYYEYRAEIFGFTMAQAPGLEAVKPSFKYYTKNWSIDNITWIQVKRT